MSQKCHAVDQVIATLCRADLELGKGRKIPVVCKLLGITGAGVAAPAARQRTAL